MRDTLSSNFLRSSVFALLTLLAGSGCGADPQPTPATRTSGSSADHPIAEVAEGYAVYPNAHVPGATLLHRAMPDGLEKFLSFGTPPSAPSIAYEVSLLNGVSGLRLVSNTLELLDKGGAPRLRGLPPFLVGADGARFDAALSVENCADDGNPCTVDTCDAAGGVAHTNAAEWTPCSDGNTCNGLEACRSGICTPEEPGATTTCAARTNITFYQSFDGDTTVDIAASGVKTPTTNDALVKAPGLFGEAIDGSTFPFIEYHTNSYAHPTSIVLSKPGSVSLWLRLRSDYTPATLFLALDTNHYLLVADDGTGIWARLSGGPPGSEDVYAYMGRPASWVPDDQWHLVVYNWSPSGIELVVDGVSTGLRSAPWMQTPFGGPATVNWIIAGGSGSGNSKDELLILDRPLTMDEILWYYDQRLHPPAVNPALERFGTDPVGCNAADDLNPCTADSCDPVLGFVHTPLANGSLCSDGFDCTPVDTCQAGVCNSGIPTGVDDGNPCTADWCNIWLGGELHTPLTGTACDDGNACTGGDVCNALASCGGGTAVTCPAPTQCQTGAACVPATGCPALVSKADGIDCSDQDACTGGDRCVSGSCQSTGGVPCAGREDVTFYQSYDAPTGIVDIAATVNAPVISYPLDRVDGLFGQALSSATNVELLYSTSVNADPTNIALSTPGSVSMWIRADSQYSPTVFDQQPLFVANDWNANLKLEIRTSLFGVEAGIHDLRTPPQALYQTSSSASTSWTTDNQWHLVVVNWSRLGIAISFDGTTTATSAPWLRSVTTGPNLGNWVYAGGTTWSQNPPLLGLAKDEVMILNRPLGEDEIQWYYDQRQSPTLPNPAVARFGLDDLGRHVATNVSFVPVSSKVLRVEVDLSGLPTLAGLVSVDLQVRKASDNSVVGSTKMTSWPANIAHADWMVAGLADYVYPSSSNNYIVTVALNGLGGFVNAYPFAYHPSPCPVHPNSCVGSGIPDSAAGTCTYAALPDGSDCNDGDACTQIDQCQAGACKGTNPVTCAGAGGGGQCETPAVCNPDTGLCLNLPVPDGFACNDGNACTRTDSCRGGTCVGENPVVCSTSDQCHGVGICDPGTGACTSPLLANNTHCDDGSACTSSDSCQNGTCTGDDSCPLMNLPGEPPLTAALFEEVGNFVADEDDEYATGINAAGDVVGYEQRPDGKTWAWKYTGPGGHFGTTTTLSGAVGSKGLAINDAGSIVGTADLTQNPIGFHTVGVFPNQTIVSHGQAFLETPTVGASIITSGYGVAVGINSDGLVAVTGVLSNGRSAVGILNGGVLDGDPPDPSDIVLGTMAHGIGPGVTPELVGSKLTTSTWRVQVDGAGIVDLAVREAFSFKTSSGFEKLNDIPATFTHPWNLQEATASNGKQIVGWGSFLQGSLNTMCHAFRLTRSTIPGHRAVLTDLGTLPNYGPGNCNIVEYHPYRATAINSKGEVVGYVTPSASTPHGGAFFYSDATGMIDLTDVIDRSLGNSLRTATGINDNGQIVGTFTKVGETKVRAYRLSLPPMFTAGPVAQFDWSMAPHFPGMDRAVAKAPMAFACQATDPCTTSTGNPGCIQSDQRIPSSHCVAAPCQPGTVASCRTSCGSIGTETCGNDGSWGSCQPTIETCDGDDNDCDGEVDEGAVCIWPHSSLDPSRRGFDVVLDASISQSPKSRIVSCTWGLPSEVKMVSPGCVASVVFPHEGTFPVTVTVATEDGTQASETHDVTIRNFIIASVGDSAASGEGSPDVSAMPAVRDPVTLELITPGKPSSWWNRRCHRSLWSSSALTARAMEDADPRTSVTFISRACSGAAILDGLLGKYGGIEHGPDEIGGTIGDTDRAQYLRPQIEAVYSLVAPRKVDALLLQIGINDANFSGVVEKCADVEGIYSPSLGNECRNTMDDANWVALSLPGPGNPLGWPNKRSYKQLADNLLMLELTNDPARIYISDYPDPTRISATEYCDEIRLLGAVSDKVGPYRLPLGIVLNVLQGFLADDAVLTKGMVLWASNVFLTNLNRSIAGTHEAQGWTYVPGVNAGFIGKPICSPQKAFVQYNESLARQGNYKGVLHPNIVGQRILASKICPVVMRDLGFSSAGCPATP